MQATSQFPTKLLIIGASGYIGGAVLAKLLEPSQAGKWDITALVRKEDYIPKLQELGVKTLIGTLDSTEVLIKAASEVDAVLNLADSDHLAGVKAIVEGLNNSQGKKIFIQTSGSDKIIDDARGEYASEKIYSDLNIDEIRSLSSSMPHHEVDTFIFENSGAVQSMIVCPPTIYGISKGPFNNISQQVPGLIKAFIQFGHTATIGNGSNIWNNVHVNDLASFYVVLLEKALAGEASTGKEGFYFCESGEHAWKDVVAKIAEELYKRKIIEKAEVGKYTTEEVDQYFGTLGWVFIASNSRSRADRARKLGWKIDGLNGSILDCIGAEIDVILAKQ